MICELDQADFCARHGQLHKGQLRELALDPGPRGEWYRTSLDAAVAAQRASPAHGFRGGAMQREGVELVPCEGCGGNVRLKVPVQSTPPTPEDQRRANAEAALISQAQAQPWPVQPKTWAYGVTTVPERRTSGLLLGTLASLRAAGFDRPRLFVDGLNQPDADKWFYDQPFAGDAILDITNRWPRVRTIGNWLLSMLELLVRNPTAERFAIFQDDLVAYPNLRAYLDAAPWPERGYLNLYTFRAENEAVIAGKPVGWHRGGGLNSQAYPADWQKGLGAVALVFTREALAVLLSSPHVPKKLMDAGDGWQRVDGMIVTAMNLAGWHEHVHQPSLVQHVGLVSSMGADDARHHNQPQAFSFRGAAFDALELLKELPGR